MNTKKDRTTLVERESGPTQPPRLNHSKPSTRFRFVAEFLIERPPDTNKLQEILASHGDQSDA